MERKDIAVKIYSKIDELPTLPIIIPNLLRLMEDPNSNTKNITQLIQNDPALASKILKVANSAYYGFSQQIADLPRAVSLLGLKMVKTLAVSIGIFNTLPSIKDSELFTREGLWLHSLATAIIMKEINKILLKKADSDYLFIIGLLHDIGKIVLDHFFHEDFKKVIQISNKDNKKLHDVEKEIIGINHTEIAAILLTRWKFPDIISDPIASLHDHEIPESTDAEDVSLLRISNSFAQELELSKEGNISANIIYERDTKILNLDDKKINQLKQAMHEKKEEIHALYHAITSS